jgi:hypothetical protein
MSERTTREEVEADYKYLIFDICCDEYLAGEVTLEQAMCDYVIQVACAEEEAEGGVCYG